MATADKSNLFSKLFRDIGKPGARIAPTTMLAIGILVLLGLVAGGFLLHSRLENRIGVRKRGRREHKRKTDEPSTRGQSNPTRPIVCCSDDCALRQSVIGDSAADFAAEQCAADYCR